jgi:thiosulfate/3-mercaptopyruvate sulfurtransferase
MPEDLAGGLLQAYPPAVESLVSTDWLAGQLGEPDLVVVDASLFMPGSGRSASAEFLDAHIPKAQFLDVDAVADRTQLAPHMLPTAAEFARAMEQLGIGISDRIVVYDNSPTRSAARGWFMLRHFGAEKVAILNGGFQKWRAEGRPIERGEPLKRPAMFEAGEKDELVTKEQLLAGIGLPWLDARSKGRFEGTEDDPRPGVARGHAPGARNLPFGSLYGDDGCLRPLDEIRELFAAAGVDPAKSFVASCGSGVTANSLIFAAHLLGNDEARLYDGSWSEWGADAATPKAIGPA